MEIILAIRDDLFIVAADLISENWINKELSSVFSLANVSESRFYLEISFRHMRNSTFLHQSAFFQRVSQKFWPKIAKPTPNQMVKNIEELSIATENHEAEKRITKRHSHRIISGILLYESMHSRYDKILLVTL